MTNLVSGGHDHAADDYTPNDFGTEDSVVKVERSCERV